MIRHFAISLFHVFVFPRITLLANKLKEMQKISEATSEATFEATSLHLVYHVRACETYTDCHSVWYEKIERREGKPKYSVNESER